MEVGRFGLLVLAGAQPVLGLIQVPPTEEEAVMPLPFFPLPRSHEQARVDSHVHKIGVEGSDHGLEGGVEVVLWAKKQPLPFGQLRRRQVSFDIAADDADEPFLVLVGVMYFRAADFPNGRNQG